MPKPPESPPTVLVFGVSGVGKTSLIAQVLPRLTDALTWQAGEIIGEARQTSDPEYLRTLPSDKLEESQELLVKGFHARAGQRNGRLVLLDAHAVIDTEHGLFDIAASIIARLEPIGLIHIEDDPAQILERRRLHAGRPRPSRTVEQLALYQDRSLGRCEHLARELALQLQRVISGDGERLERAVRMMLVARG